MLYIGIDLGTSAVKLLLVDSERTIKNMVSKESPLNFPNLAGASKPQRTGGKPFWKVFPNC